MTTLLALEEDLETKRDGSPSGLAGWHEAAPKAVRKAAKKEDTEAAWSAWVEHLLRRKSPKPLEKLLKARSAVAALRWGIADKALKKSIAAVALLDSPADEAELFNGAAAGPLWLAVVHSLPRAAKKLDADAWWTLLQGALSAVEDAKFEAVGVATLAGQWLRGELPLTLAFLFPELTPCRELLNGAREVLSQGIDELLDGEGVLHAKEWNNLQPLLACWTRCRALGGELDGGCWNDDAESQFPALVREVLRHSRPDGGQLLDATNAEVDGELIAAAVHLADDASLRRLSKRVDDPRIAANARVEQKRFGRPAVTSEWAQSALLRSSWAKSSPRLGVWYSDKILRTELTAGRESLWSGAWDVQIKLNGELTRPNTDWEEVCWFSDREVDYLELEIGLDSGWLLQRKMMLARDGGSLFLADALVGDRPAAIEYRATLPLCPNARFKPAKQTREGRLQIGKTDVLALPLALPEWRSDPRVGELLQTEAGLELRQAFTGRALFAPLWFDLNPRRNRRSYTWRQLTVAENREILPRDRAAGFRVQVGSDQWLVYRSFQQPANRTLLGHNLISESLIATFTKKGTIEPLVEVE